MMNFIGLVCLYCMYMPVTFSEKMTGKWLFGYLLLVETDLMILVMLMTVLFTCLR